MTIEREFAADDAVLEEIIALTEGELEKVDCPMKIMVQISIAVEEIFVNIAHYAYPDGNGTMTYKLETDTSSVKITFIDAGIPFDPLSKPDPDISLSADERPIGGLGIYMVKKSMDDVRYANVDGKNILTICKNF